jgi:hypothetical protein
MEDKQNYLSSASNATSTLVKVDTMAHTVNNNFISSNEYSLVNAGPQSTTDPSLGGSSNIGTEINYLSVDSAEIKCPEHNSARNQNSSQEKLQRMYRLALLFYELFSGGQRPTSELRSLASFDGAFVSLSTSTLIKEEDYPSSNEPKRYQGPSGSNRKVGLCKLSFEYLKFMGIPSSLCYLVLNILDCVHGDLCGNECYTSVSDIASDLQLMLDQPKFLQGLDQIAMSSPGSQLKEISISRKQEIESILSCYDRCVSVSSEIAILKGASGAGKSFLTQLVGSFIISKGGLFLMGKFDQMQQSRPFSALASALDQYCDILISQLGSLFGQIW